MLFFRNLFPLLYQTHDSVIMNNAQSDSEGQVMRGPCNVLVRAVQHNDLRVFPVGWSLESGNWSVLQSSSGLLAAGLLVAVTKYL